jgi:hypothetical protein
VLLLAAGSVLTLCALSVMYGMLIRKSMAEVTLSEFRIEVLNGSGQKGLAQRVAHSARKRGIDVLHVGNAENDAYDESILIARRAVSNLDALAKALDCDNVVEQYQPASLVDATLIVGADRGSPKTEGESSVRP